MTNIGLVNFAIRAYNEGWGYVWGTFGDVLTPALLRQKISQYPSQVGGQQTFISTSWINKRVVDCVGLIKAYLWWDESKNNPVYTPAQDKTADGYHDMATIKGTMDNMPELPGICLWRKGHVGVYIGNGNVIESKGTAYGVVKSEVRNGSWTGWFECAYIEYSKLPLTDFKWAVAKGILDGSPADTMDKAAVAIILRKYLDEQKEEIEQILDKVPEAKPVDTEWDYRYEGITHIAEIEPMALKCTDMVLKAGADIPFKNAINGNLFLWSGDVPKKSIGWLISEGVVLAERHEYLTWKGNPKGTFIVYRTGEVFVGWKWDSDIVRELNKIWFCCQGINLYQGSKTPTEIATEEGWVDVASLLRATTRMPLGYNKLKNKAVVTCRQY